MFLTDGFYRLLDGYLWTWTIRDHRVDGRFLMSSVKPVILFTLSYLAIANYGPQFMLQRKPFKLNFSMLVYNVVITLLSFHVCKELLIASYRNDYNWFCEPKRNSTDREEMRIVSAMYLYFISKLIEFLDTIFIITRKREKQLSFLHVYHHSTMFVFAWIGARWYPGGISVFAGILNSFVHVLMYSYYALSTLGPNVAKYLFWKRYVTLVQLIQFLIGLILGIIYIKVDCPYPAWIKYLNLFYMLSYLILFGRFYFATYKAKQKIKSM